MRWLDGIIDSMDESEQAPGDGEGQGSLYKSRYVPGCREGIMD